MGADVLEKFSVTRGQLQSIIDGCLRAMEQKVIPESCHHLMAPLLRKSVEIAKSGTPAQCQVMEKTLSERLGQLAEDIFRKLSASHG